MKVAIHQPLYLPYPGFFQKLSLVDAFVIMDDVQYDKRFTNRNRILNPQGPTYLTVPINKQHKFLPNMYVQINNQLPWGEYHWKTIYFCYANAKFFRLYDQFFNDLFKKRWDQLFDLDLHTMKQLMDWLMIRIPIIRESELNVKGEGTERLINACKAVGADVYLSGRGGRNYMNERLFEKNNIKLEYQDYVARPYPQRFFKNFVPDLSVIDMLFNIGPESANFIAESQLISMSSKYPPPSLQQIEV